MTLPLKFVPFIGVLLSVLGIIFAIIAASDVPEYKITDPSTPMTHTGSIVSTSRYTILAYAFVISGGFMLIAPNRS